MLGLFVETGETQMEVQKMNFAQVVLAKQQRTMWGQHTELYPLL